VAFGCPGSVTVSPSLIPTSLLPRTCPLLSKKPLNIVRVDGKSLQKPLRSGFREKRKGCSGASNPLCFVFLKMVAGVRFELTTFGL
jgi:hypothetical protein